MVHFDSHGFESSLVKSFFLLKSDMIVGKDLARFSMVANPMLENQFTSSFTGDVLCTWNELGKSGERIYNCENIIEVVEIVQRDEINEKGVV